MKAASSIRLREAFIFQAPTALGLVMFMPALTARSVAFGLLACFGAVLVAASILAVNDWADIHLDSQNSLKHKDTFVQRGVTPNQMLSMAAALAAAGLLAFAALSGLHVVLGIVAIALGIAYSAQFGDVKGKCIPVVSSLLHVGGTLIAFMLGALTYASADWRSVLIAAYPVLLILAGHLVQEIQDYEEDRLSGCRTNAVQFGRKRVFVLASAIFAVSFVLLYSLAALGLFPPFIRFTPVLYLAYLAIALRAYRLGLTRDAVKSLRDQYRLLFGALVGIILLGSFLGKLPPA